MVEMFRVYVYELFVTSSSHSLSIMEATNLPLVQSRVLQAVVEATLYHGEKQLCPTVTTTAKVINLSVKWGETLVFKIAKKNIPKSAKILIQISEPYQRRESAPNRRSSKFIYWGLCTVFDHEYANYCLETMSCFLTVCMLIV